MLAGVASAADEALVLRTRAAHLAGQNRCADALPILDEVRALAPEDFEAALLQGKCLFQAKRYAEAVPALEDASRLDANSGEAALVLGMAKYHAGDVAGAGPALERAEQLLPESPEAALYRGLVLLEENRMAEASSRFDRAAGYRGALEPAAAYYAGLVHASEGRRSEAEASLERAKSLAPGSVWAQRADEALAAPSASHRMRRWLVLYAGLDYDTNVAQRSDAVVLPSDVSEQDDGRGWWGAEAGTELFRRGAWGGGVLGSYYGNAHFHAEDFDEHQLGASVWIDRSLGESTLLRFQPEFGQSFFNYNDYRRHYGALTELLHAWNERHRGTFYARYLWNDYRFRDPSTPPLDSVRDRDGHSVRFGYDHFWQLDAKTELHGGPMGRVYVADGAEYDHWGVGAWAGVERQLPWELTLDVLGSVSYDDYDDPSTFLFPGESVTDRQDVISLVRVAVSRPITDRVTLTARWRYQNNHSNTLVFDYDRHIVGAYVTVAFGD